MRRVGGGDGFMTASWSARNPRSSYVLHTSRSPSSSRHIAHRGLGQQEEPRRRRYRKRGAESVDITRSWLDLQVGSGRLTHRAQVMPVPLTVPSHHEASRYPA